MLLKKIIASLKNPSCDNGTGGQFLLCAPSLQWDGLWAGKIEQAQDRSWSQRQDRLGVGASPVCTAPYVADWWTA